jgi:hypothetical protein
LILSKFASKFLSSAKPMSALYKIFKIAFVVMLFSILFSEHSFSQTRLNNKYGNVYRQKINISTNYPLVNSIKPHYSFYLDFESILYLTMTKQMTGAVFPRIGYTVGTLEGDTASIDYKALSIGLRLNKYFRLRNSRNAIIWNFGLGYEIKALADAEIFNVTIGKTGFPKENKSPTLFMQTGVYYMFEISRYVQFIPGIEFNYDFNNYKYPINQYIPGYGRTETQIDLVAGFSFYLN